MHMSFFRLKIVFHVYIPSYLKEKDENTRRIIYLQQARQVIICSKFPCIIQMPFKLRIML
jgi:hypothetical protein